MLTFRIIELPEMKAAFSGPMTDRESFEKFASWFSGYHASLKHELFPRDFMWYNEKRGAQEWFYALPCEYEGNSIDGYEIVDLPHGLFAVASCMDADLDRAADWMKTREEILSWVQASDRFELYVNGDGKRERYPMFHIVSPGYMYKDGLSIEDLYVPIRLKEPDSSGKEPCGE